MKCKSGLVEHASNILRDTDGAFKTFGIVKRDWCSRLYLNEYISDMVFIF